MHVTVAKVGQGRPKSKDYSRCLTSAILPNINVIAQVNGVPEPENLIADQGFLTIFVEVMVTYSIYNVRHSKLYDLHDNVDVAAISIY